MDEGLYESLATSELERRLAGLRDLEAVLSTSISSKTGQRYLSRSSQLLIFARHEQKDEFGTSPYLFLGPAQYASHTGDRPIAITWKLEHDMPSDFFTIASAVAQ